MGGNEIFSEVFPEVIRNFHTEKSDQEIFRTCKMNRKLILYITASPNGYIAKPGDDLSFLTIVRKKDEDYITIKHSDTDQYKRTTITRMIKG